MASGATKIEEKHKGNACLSHAEAISGENTIGHADPCPLPTSWWRLACARHQFICVVRRASRFRKNDSSRSCTSASFAPRLLLGFDKPCM